ncbi:hypothetical protein LEP3755_33920 [Leptolyngbya sp. NIES-3755]|nr:hypothetical protein LEP3755_33920 [Leptolyngbya sp. NIES-3755]
MIPIDIPNLYPPVIQPSSNSDVVSTETKEENGLIINKTIKEDGTIEIEVLVKDFLVKD